MCDESRAWTAIRSLHVYDDTRSVERTEPAFHQQSSNESLFPETAMTDKEPVHISPFFIQNVEAGGNFHRSIGEMLCRWPEISMLYSLYWNNIINIVINVITLHYQTPRVLWPFPLFFYLVFWNQLFSCIFICAFGILKTCPASDVPAMVLKCNYANICIFYYDSQVQKIISVRNILITFKLTFILLADACAIGHLQATNLFPRSLTGARQQTKMQIASA